MAFDHNVHHRDRKTGKISHINPYSMECHREMKFYRRNGRCFDAAGVEIPDPKLEGHVAGVALSSLAPQAPAQVSAPAQTLQAAPAVAKKI